jgi:carbon-monoxide dehydrogenase large subunit
VGLPKELGIGLDGTGSFDSEPPNFPNGCHAAEVEIDPETGRIVVSQFAVIDDVGRVINPILVAGQVHGGLAQGIGQALMENVAYDAASGQSLSASFMDYCMPRADDLPSFAIGHHDVPSPTNPLGVKGVGEAGCVAAPPALLNAVLDALAPLGVKTCAMPITPERVWRAITQARGG